MRPASTFTLLRAVDDADGVCTSSATACEAATDTGEVAICALAIGPTITKMQHSARRAKFARGGMRLDATLDSGQDMQYTEARSLYLESDWQFCDTHTEMLVYRNQLAASYHFPFQQQVDWLGDFAI